MSIRLRLCESPSVRSPCASNPHRPPRIRIYVTTTGQSQWRGEGETLRAPNLPGLTSRWTAKPRTGWKGGGRTAAGVPPTRLPTNRLGVAGPHLRAYVSRAVSDSRAGSVLARALFIPLSHLRACLCCLSPCMYILSISPSCRLFL